MSNSAVTEFHLTCSNMGFDETHKPVIKGRTFYSHYRMLQLSSLFTDDGVKQHKQREMKVRLVKH